MRQRMRERRGWLLPSLYLLILGAIVAFTYFAATASNWSQPNIQGSAVGVALFLVLSYSQLALLLLMAPIFSAGSITIEKEQRTLAGLLTSLLTTTQIWWGKFVSSILFVLLLLITGLPVLSMAFAFGGVGPWEIFTATLDYGDCARVHERDRALLFVRLPAQRARDGRKLRRSGCHQCGDRDHFFRAAADELHFHVEQPRLVRYPVRHSRSHVPEPVFLPHRVFCTARTALSGVDNVRGCIYCRGSHCGCADRAQPASYW